MFHVMVVFALGLTLHAAVLVSPFEAIRLSYPAQTLHIVKKNIMLTGEEATHLSQQSRLKLNTKIYRTYAVRSADRLIAYGVLITRKVRSKNAAVLYLIDTLSDAIKSIEIVAFHEPPEYIPPAAWLQQFHGKRAKDALYVGKNIPTISGATMSARTLSESARLALALYEHLLKGRK